MNSLKKINKFQKYSFFEDKKLVKSLAEHIEDNEFKEVSKLLRKKLKKWTKTTFRIGVFGQARTGKTLVKDLFNMTYNINFSSKKYWHRSLQSRLENLNSKPKILRLSFLMDQKFFDV